MYIYSIKFQRNVVKNKYKKNNKIKPTKNYIYIISWFFWVFIYILYIYREST